MCEIFTAMAVGGAVAAGGAAATGGAISLGTLVTGAGLGASVFGSISASNAAASETATEMAVSELNARLLSSRSNAERVLTAVADERTREVYRREIGRQGAELVARGIDLSSPTAVLLGETAAREMTFESAAIRQEGAATQAELAGAQASLTLSERQLRARRKNQLMSGNVTAAERLLTTAPDIWPGLMS